MNVNDDHNRWFPAGNMFTGTMDWIFQRFEFTSGPDVGKRKSYFWLHRLCASGTAWEKKRPTTRKTSVAARPDNGPETPTSNSARRSGIRSEMRIIAPNVPSGGNGAGRKIGGDVLRP